MPRVFLQVSAAVACLQLLGCGGQRQVAGPPEPESLADVGRSIYLREQCDSCHTVEHGVPDSDEQVSLVKYGGRYPAGWHFAHLRDPTSTVPASTMPAYPQLFSQSFAPITTDAMRLEAEELAAVIREQALVDASWDQEAVAVVAYIRTFTPDPTTQQVEATPVLVAGPDPSNAVQVADGAAAFAMNCAVCHGADLTGFVGPNLRDDVWIHGGELVQIKSTIATGVPSRGCPSWKHVLGDVKIDQLTAFIYATSHSD